MEVRVTLPRAYDLGETNHEMIVPYFTTVFGKKKKKEKKKNNSHLARHFFNFFNKKKLKKSLHNVSQNFEQLAESRAGRTMLY